MKGIIFTEFFDLVEEAFGFEIAAQLIDQCDLPSGGAYTAVGTYDHTEILALVGMLSKLTAVPAPALMVSYGKFLYPKLHAQLDSMGLNFGSSFELFKALHEVIHPEVLKLYPDAELPEFEATPLSDNQLLLKYRSCRPLAHVAEGLIYGAGDLYQENLSVQLEHKNATDDFHTDITITRA
ncbi:Guanylate cyclase-related protein [Aequoribacter fuscus]|jgi:hypothetical protein|uniref:Guanylate cyclase-related protein n=1 Tax=Aequoribacter fuscus TaxID=2518989 RepID=F3L1T5_9GAMM|nr:heme NO-binding domain-containing protein [Aequoribacter fuscus]EGG29697.1 Guanylate cyclase-related protein [Aequoribacter fuscus]QHJ88970.1 hypothetical protein EYZ66_11995 [Aequoribacter fuscus]